MSGGSSGGTTETSGTTTSTGYTTITGEIDYAYNSRMAGVAEAQIALAQDYYDWWMDNWGEYESALADSNLSLLPSQTELQQMSLDSSIELLPSQTALTSEGIAAMRAVLPSETAAAISTNTYTSGLYDAKTGLLDEQAALSGQQIAAGGKLLDLAMEGRNETEEMDLAGNDVKMSSATQTQTALRELADMGVRAGGSQATRMVQNMGTEAAANEAAARTEARRTAKNDSLAMLYQGISGTSGLGLGS